MILLLRDILHNPGVLPFEFELDLSDTEFLSVKAWNSPLKVSGTIRNSADILTLNCTVQSNAVMLCDRCGKEFRSQSEQEFEAILSDELQDEDNPDIFLIKGNSADLGDIVRTLFVLEMPTESLCGDDCEFPGLEF
ncbi:MAG: DUF177 domain-containing protein [Oscillospiraceae bacterium]|jgi:uncharacterized protein|nr:DUF177 domain-containing protein [Oscillospiraceae bacterium]